MRVLWKCCIRALKENKNRTLVTIIGVAMATAMIMVLSCIGTTTLASAIAYQKTMKGIAHERFYGVQQENLKFFTSNQSIDQAWLAKTIGLGLPDFEQDSSRAFMIKLSGVQEGWYEANALHVTSGRFPENENEVALKRIVRGKSAKDLNLGDTMYLTMQSGEIKELTIVGFVERGNHRNLFDYDMFSEDDDYYADQENRYVWTVYDAYTYWDGDATSEGTYDISIRFTKNGLYHHHEVTRGLLNVSEELYQKKYLDLFQHLLSDAETQELHNRVKRHNVSSMLEELEGMSPFHLTQTTVWIIAFSEVIFLVFVLAGVFCINNSFDISITERIKFFGMISSVGTTKRQRRRIIWMEAFVIALFGIPIGILTGIGVSFALAKLVDGALQKYLMALGVQVVFKISGWAILIAVFQAIFMIALSAMEAAFRASKISPIEAIRSNESIQSKGKAKKTPKLFKKLFGIGGGIAWQNFKRSKIKYRATTVSVAVSVALLIGMSSLSMLFGFTKDEIKAQIDYQVYVYSYHKNGYEALREVANKPEVTSFVLVTDSMRVVEEGTDLKENYPKILFTITGMNDEAFEKLCVDNGIDPNEAKGKGLVNNSTEDYQKGMILSGVNLYGADRYGEPGKPVEVEIVGTYDRKTLVQGVISYSRDKDVYVSESWIAEHQDQFLGWGVAYFNSSDANALVEAIDAMDLPDVNITNYDMLFQMIHFAEALVKLMSAGFLVLIILIGVTNIINAVTFNMQLRMPEFAKLRAIGMTGKQFRGMIFMEGAFIAIKGLLWGFLFGCTIHYGVYYFVSSSADMLWSDPEKKFTYAYQPPVIQIFASIITVAALLYLILSRYSKKSENNNIIETIRNENL
ncbi:MAG: ABC transporter permease [Acetatifactor sp.]|nr:ABC transporter permease [Acetatifactor sp.]